MVRQKRSPLGEHVRVDLLVQVFVGEHELLIGAEVQSVLPGGLAAIGLEAAQGSL